MGKSKGRGGGNPSSESGVSKVIRQRLRSAIRMVWSRYSSERANVLHRSKRTSKRYNKDGTTSKVPMVTYLCAECNGEYGARDVQVDHIIALGATPDFPPGGVHSWDEWLDRLFCDEENLRVLCKICHLAKTREDRALLKGAKDDV